MIYDYFLQKKLLSFEFLSMLLYLSGIMLQIFFYCWYGNELELKVTSSIVKNNIEKNACITCLCYLF